MNRMGRIGCYETSVWFTQKVYMAERLMVHSLGFKWEQCVCVCSLPRCSRSWWFFSSFTGKCGWLPRAPRASRPEPVLGTGGIPGGWRPEGWGGKAMGPWAAWERCWAWSWCCCGETYNEWARGKKVEKYMPQTKHTASGRPIQKHRWGYRDIYTLMYMQVIFDDPANKTIFMLLGS